MVLHQRLAFEVESGHASGPVKLRQGAGGAMTKRGLIGPFFDLLTDRPGLFTPVDNFFTGSSPASSRRIVRRLRQRRIAPVLPPNLLRQPERLQRPGLHTKKGGQSRELRLGNHAPPILDLAQAPSPSALRPPPSTPAGPPAGAAPAAAPPGPRRRRARVVW